jgi:MinD-like ATPase involved in chromosome partitioning or flagellar assembly
MSTSRYTVLALASPRTQWAQTLTQWASSGALPIECVKCVSADELIARLESGRKWSAAVLDGGLASVDRDLLNRLDGARVPAIVVDDLRVVRDWRSLGAARTLPPALDRVRLLEALADVAIPVDDSVVEGSLPSDVERAPIGGAVIAVCGAGGVGTSTVAAALAQGFALDRGRHPFRHGDIPSTVLVDGCRNAEQAMLHDALDVSRGIQELCEAHRTGRPDSLGVRSVTIDVPTRGYELVAGLRRARFWAAIKSNAFAATLESLAATFSTVIVDIDADFEGEAEGGSIDVEDRNSLSRLTLARADCVVVVGVPSMKGLHAMHRILVDVANSGAPAGRVQPVFNQAVRSAKTRSSYTRALADLASWRPEDALPPIYLPARDTDAVHRDGAIFPDAIVAPLLGAVRPLLSGSVTIAVSQPKRWRRIGKGELGTAADDIDVMDEAG